MSRHQEISRGWYRFWMSVNGVILTGLAAFILQPALIGGAGTADGTPETTLATSGPVPSGPADSIPTKADVLAPAGLRFGLSSPQTPWSPAETERLALTAGAQPTMLQYFVKWSETPRPEAIELSYRQGALPIISWEPWAGAGESFDQPRYALRTIIRGEHDAYLTRFATMLRDARYPVAIRFAHEMNGDWYPWSESRSGNRRGDYVKAWRHVHDVFGRVGADNVIWIWSPNIIRALRDVSLTALYPGDRYVDWIGTVGYAIGNRGADQVFDLTLDALAKVSDKPVLITETGAESGALKVGWISDFFRWLPRQENLVGFVWFEYSEDQGGNKDWRFSTVPECAEAFRAGLAGLDLAGPPAG